MDDERLRTITEANNGKNQRKQHYEKSTPESRPQIFIFDYFVHINKRIAVS